MQRLALIVAVLAALGTTAVSGLVLVPFLRKLKFGQTIYEEGPKWHAAKQGTPTMGGFMFIIGSSIGLLVAYPIMMAGMGEIVQSDAALIVLGVITSIAFAAIGFLDDYLKVVKKQNLGLHGKVKFTLQCLVAISFLAALSLMGRLSTMVSLPVFGVVEFGWFFYPLSLVLIVGMNNAVNLTDGIDGLCGSVTLWVMCGYLAILIAFDRAQLSLWAAALCGGCMGFLIWNFYPAKVFMGDTGSLFLGGAVVCMAYCMGRPELAIILGLCYLLEALSVMLQVGFFKLTKRFSKERKGKRIFKMSPIHHHFEMSGWGEVRIDVVFSIFTIVCVGLCYLYAVVFG